MTWSYLKVFQLSKDNIAGHNERKRKKRLTYEDVGRQYLGAKLRQLNTVVERDCRKVICGAPTTS